MRRRISILGVAAAIALGAWLGGALAAAVQPPGTMVMEPLRDSGQSVTGAFEGWYQNPDGTFTLLLGYFNRNVKETLEIPVGPNNRIEPGGPDQGQPTSFLPRRQWGVFTITVPKDFGTKKLTWTLVANGYTTTIPMHLNPLWNIEPFHHAMGNTPPRLKFDPNGREQQGPPREISASFTAKVAEPLTLTAWVADDGLTTEGQVRGAIPSGARRGGDEAATPPGGRGGAGRGLAGRGLGASVSLNWSKFRGPGVVTFASVRPSIDPSDGKSSTTATFSAPGEYTLRLQANDASGEGGGGFQCCWTNAHVKVAVTGGTGSVRDPR